MHKSWITIELKHAGSIVEVRNVLSALHYFLWSTYFSVFIAVNILLYFQVVALKKLLRNIWHK